MCVDIFEGTWPAEIFLGLADEGSEAEPLNSLRIQGGFAPLKSPTRDLRPLTPRLASEAIGPDASLGIELVLRMAWRMIIPTRSNESAVATLLRAERGFAKG